MLINSIESYSILDLIIDDGPMISGIKIQHDSAFVYTQSDLQKNQL